MSDAIGSWSPTRTCQDKIDVGWYFKELLLTYKFGEKHKFRKALDILGPYLDDRLRDYFEEIYKESLWLNPWTGKKGY